MRTERNVCIYGCRIIRPIKLCHRKLLYPNLIFPKLLHFDLMVTSDFSVAIFCIQFQSRGFSPSNELRDRLKMYSEWSSQSFKSRLIQPNGRLGDGFYGRLSGKTGSRLIQSHYIGKHVGRKIKSRI